MRTVFRRGGNGEGSGALAKENLPVNQNTRAELVFDGGKKQFGASIDWRHCGGSTPLDGGWVRAGWWGVVDWTGGAA